MSRTSEMLESIYADPEPEPEPVEVEVGPLVAGGRSLADRLRGGLSRERLREIDLSLKPAEEMRIRATGKPSDMAAALRQIDGLVHERERDRSRHWSEPQEGDPVYAARLFGLVRRYILVAGLDPSNRDTSYDPGSFGPPMIADMGGLQAERRAKLWNEPLPAWLIDERSR